MSEITVVLVAALIGVAGGLGGGLLAAVASLRASQLAARAPLADAIADVAVAAVEYSGAPGSVSGGGNDQFHSAWNRLSVQQRILCPSSRIEALLALVLEAATQPGLSTEQRMTLIGESLEKISQMVGAHSRRLLRTQASYEEIQILERWLATRNSSYMSSALQRELRTLTSGPS